MLLNGKKVVQEISEILFFLSIFKEVCYLWNSKIIESNIIIDKYNW